MPELKWDEFDFFYCLEVEPEIEEYGISYAYKVRRDDLILYLTVRPWESLIEMSIYQGEAEVTLLDCALFVEGEVRRISDKRGERLELNQCLMAPRRFAQLEPERLWKAAAPGWRVEISVKPRIQIRYLD